MTSVCFLPKTRIAIGTVLASPDKNSDQPSSLRRSPLNLSASSRPAPKPMAPRVAASSASSGTVTLLGSEIFTFILLTQCSLQSACRQVHVASVLAAHEH